jgi:hypothetical protein
LGVKELGRDDDFLHLINQGCGSGAGKKNTGRTGMCFKRKAKNKQFVLIVPVFLLNLAPGSGTEMRIRIQMRIQKPIEFRSGNTTLYFNSGKLSVNCVENNLVSFKTIQIKNKFKKRELH